MEKTEKIPLFTELSDEEAAIVRGGITFYRPPQFINPWLRVIRRWA